MHQKASHLIFFLWFESYNLYQRFCNRSLLYADAYSEGLNGREAAYATKVYRGHRAIPTDYLRDFELSGAIERFRQLRFL
ncbi:hypothetical protein B0H13DRAFT_1612550 [Mycena leptocephala]|nr:hypothetical protein B0H13DRAFT_1612550 [Mycena leptocephala]